MPRLLPGRLLLCSVSAWLWIAAVAALATAQQDTIAESLGLTPDRLALPVWSNPSPTARLELGKQVRASHAAVLIVGHPKHGHGTGFVVSKRHRLLVTNAHVADIASRSEKLLAVANGSPQSYNVAHVWYHPGVKRRLQNQASLVVLSTNPADGPVEPTSPDVALLQLASDGPELAAELPLATPQELQNLFGQQVAFLGFPGHDFRTWPSIGNEAAATYHDGVVSRLTDFQLNGGAAPQNRQCVQYTMASWGGYSGSPVFLPNGHVVAVHNMVRHVRGPAGDVKSIAHGVRIDCLWELLAHHKLLDQVPIPVEPATLRIGRWLEKDEQGEKYRRAVNLGNEAWYLIHGQRKFAEGVETCNEAIKLAPNYAELYAVRYAGRLNYVFETHRNVSRDVSLGQLRIARRDAEKYIQLVPSDPVGLVNLAMVINNTAYLTKQQDEFRRVLAIGDRLLSAQNLPGEMRARAHSLRGMAYGNLGNRELALAEHNEALRLAPNSPGLWETRADYWRNQGRDSLADSDTKKARELREKLARPQSR